MLGVHARRYAGFARQYACFQEESSLDCSCRARYAQAELPSYAASDALGRHTELPDCAAAINTHPPFCQAYRLAHGPHAGPVECCRLTGLGAQGLYNNMIERREDLRLQRPAAVTPFPLIG